MKKALFIFLACVVITSVWRSEAHAARSCAQDLAGDLLAAILSKDAGALKEIANNPDVFDESTLNYLVGDVSVHFYGRPDLMSAHSVLEGRMVLTKVTVADAVDGSQLVEVVYLPTSTASDFAHLAKMVALEQAIPFRDYVVCAIVIKGESISMPNACYAETDVLD